MPRTQGHSLAMLRRIAAALHKRVEIRFGAADEAQSRERVPLMLWQTLFFGVGVVVA